MKLTILMENESCAPEYGCAFGLSLYLETGEHRILFDAGPDGGFADNARALGVDLGRVTLAVLSHSHYDHADGLAAFFARNASAPVYARTPLFAPCFSWHGDSLDYVGVDPALEAYRDRFIPVEGDMQPAEGLTLFRSGRDFPTAPSGLVLRTPGGSEPDPFLHEHSLLAVEGERAVVLAGCSHRGIVNIVRRAARILGRAPDAVVGGFHLMDATPGQKDSDELLDRIAAELDRGDTTYYSGHCTGDYAFSRLQRRLGSRLIRVKAGMQFKL